MVTYDDRAAKLFIYPSILFMIVGMTIGVFIAFNGFIFPDYFAGEYIHFGRVRPVHVGTVTLLWLLSVNIGLMLYFIPRLCGVSLWSQKLALWSALLWWFALIIGVNSYPWGTNFGWEYAELPNWVSWIPVKFIFIGSWVMIVVNFFMTISNRRFEKLYVSLWYSMGTIIWTTFVVLAGSVAINWVPEGMSRVNVSWFYVHNLVGLIYTPMGLATAYYFLPKLANTPIYSHRLSMIGFWSIAFIYAWIGTHHIIHGPMSQWLQTTSIVFSIWMFIPVWTVVYNLFATLQKDWRKYLQSAPIRFLMMGNIFYLITCAQGSLQSLRNVNEITSKTDWIIGHSHISLYGTFTFFAIAGLYQAIPTIVKKPLWSNKLADWHFALNLWGSLLFLFSLWLGGFLQGLMWANWADGSSYAEFHDNLTRLPFIQTVADMRDWWILRGLGGIVILFGNIIFVVNMFNTIVLKSASQVDTPREVRVTV
ncbi:putative cytochrome c oxidase, subunit I [Candidatus Protochlamydia naegleriophila]|uniref:Putative cytochrome c oxidase, subunit I n=1 Tax=Candidatus Protochlamydia naegleriophila TaxID=389348 RepID=A0A0U5JAI0_9BACT|nr:cbb3-type cytochrome c oxidase subunit I [Candidatus Protochlamydia naegleriophila]CUI15666.1 putative cytochrome c oxidase, subunit I [Candidatus Protochlamydia naegleriophila]